MEKEKNEILVEVQNVSKKFCYDLKLGLWYGLKDMFSDIIGRKPKQTTLRKKEFWASKDISFTLRRGECIGLIGHNGAGKSTLLKVLNGLYAPDAGTIKMKGKIGALIELGAGFNPILTGRENIYNNASILGFTRSQVDKKMQSIIDFSEIEEFLDTPVKNYSSGMKVRLGFAVAAHLEPDILIIDEVLAVGDLGFVLKCFKKIDEILPNTAFIFVSHNMPMVSRICNQIILMEKGKVAYQGEDVAKGIDLYYNRFTNSEQNVIFDSKDIILESVSILNEDKTEKTNAFNWLDSIYIEIKIQNINLIKSPFVKIQLADKELRGIAELNLDRIDIKIEKNKTYTFNVCYPKNQLSKGVYSLNIVMTKDYLRDPIYRVNTVVSFAVTNEVELWQSFMLQSTIELLEEDKND